MDRNAAKYQVLNILSRHVGKEKAIGMAELYGRVFDRPWKNKINDTRLLREIITELRREGALIGETRSQTGGGYYLARSSHELTQFFERRKREALKKLDMIAKMQRIGLGELLGQMQLNLGQYSPCGEPVGAGK